MSAAEHHKLYTEQNKCEMQISVGPLRSEKFHTGVFWLPRHSAGVEGGKVAKRWACQCVLV